jgi:hypothetical protein
MYVSLKNIAPCSGVEVDVSEVCTASIIRARKELGHIPEGRYVHNRRRENLKSRTVCMFDYLFAGLKARRRLWIGLYASAYNLRKKQTVPQHGEIHISAV